jgi:hypothetical protein
MNTTALICSAVSRLTKISATERYYPALFTRAIMKFLERYYGDQSY